MPNSVPTPQIGAANTEARTINLRKQSRRGQTADLGGVSPSFDYCNFGHRHHFHFLRLEKSAIAKQNESFRRQRSRETGARWTRGGQWGRCEADYQKWRRHFVSRQLAKMGYGCDAAYAQAKTAAIEITMRKTLHWCFYHQITGIKHLKIVNK